MRIQTAPLGLIEANCYLLTDEATGLSALIDPGEAGPALDALIRSAPGPVELIILTHRHWDHILGGSSAKAQTGARVAVHELDACGLRDPRQSLALFHRLPQQPVNPNMLLRDGDTLPLGQSELVVLHTPGHTAGGICIRCDENLFTGDTLFCGGIGRADLPTGDYPTLLRSLAKLAAIPGNLAVYPGHGPATTLVHERKFNPDMREAIS